MVCPCCDDELQHDEMHCIFMPGLGHLGYLDQAQTKTPPQNETMLILGLQNGKWLSVLCDWFNGSSILMRNMSNILQCSWVTLINCSALDVFFYYFNGTAFYQTCTPLQLRLAFCFERGSVEKDSLFLDTADYQ